MYRKIFQLISLIMLAWDCTSLNRTYMYCKRTPEDFFLFSCQEVATFILIFSGIMEFNNFTKTRNDIDRYI